MPRQEVYTSFLHDVFTSPRDARKYHLHTFISGKSLTITYRHNVVCEYYLDEHSLTLFDGGHQTATTKRILNNILSALDIPYSIVQTACKWYIASNHNPRATIPLITLDNQEALSFTIYFTPGKGYHFHL